MHMTANKVKGCFQWKKNGRSQSGTTHEPVGQWVHDKI